MRWRECYEDAVFWDEAFGGLSGALRTEVVGEVVAPVVFDPEIALDGVDVRKIAEAVSKGRTALPVVQPYRSIWDDNLRKCPDPDDQEVVGFEGLGRGIFQHKGKYYLVPAGVLFGEGRDIGGEIGLQVIERAAALAVRANASRKKPLSLSANLSKELLRRKSLVGDVKRILRETGLDVGNFVFELLENVDLAKEGEGAIATIREIVGMGIKLTVDDLGTEYSVSNLEALMKAKVAVAEVKFDGSFSERMVDRSFWKEIDSHLLRAEKAGAKMVVWEGLASGLGMDKIEAIREYHRKSEVGRRWADRALFEGGVV